MHKIFVCLLSSIFYLNVNYAQLTFSNQSNATTLAQTLSGPNVTISNASVIGAQNQFGLFNSTSSFLNMSSGVVMSTGQASQCVGPNNNTSLSSSFGTAGDNALTNIAGYQTNDKVELKFDFQVETDQVEFNYIFASEEYNEYVGTSFNDVFAFFISGPGIVGEQNLAVVPGTTSPVTINSINLSNYWQFFNSNENGTLTNHVQFDGFTTKMKAFKSGLTPCSTYTLRLVLADGSDSSYDSWVLLEENSLVQGNVSVVSNTPTADNTALEGCIKASFTFHLDQALPYDSPINYLIQGTALNGIDYAKIDDYVIIPSGQTSATIFIDAIADGLTEGQETIHLLYKQSPCATYDTIKLYINDMQAIDYTLSGVNLTCNSNESGQINANISGGTAPYSLAITGPNNYSSIISSNNLPLTGLSAGIYNIEVDDVYGCAGDAQVVGAEFDAGQTFLPDGNGNVYTSSLNISGFGSATLTDPNQLQSICLNMEHSSLGEVQIKLIAPNGTELILKQRFNNSDGGHTDLGEPVANGPVDAGNSSLLPGIGYDYCFTNNPVYGTMVQEKSNYTHTYTDLTGNTITDNYLPSGAYTPYQNFSQLIGVPLDGTWTIWVKDHNPQDNGYIFNWNISFTNANSGNTVVLTEPLPNVITSNQTLPNCGSNNGAIDVSVSGPGNPYTYLWSNGATTQDISGIPSGNYSLTVTNSQNCQTIKEFNVSNATGSTVTATIQNETCINANNGAISTSISGTIQSILWSNGATTQNIYNLAPGTYTITVTNASGCLTVKTYEILAATPIQISSNILNEQCGNMEGEIDLTVSGGIAPYTYSWSNGITTQDLTDLNQNNYTVNVTDNYGCLKTGTFAIINLVGNCTPNCDLSINSSNIQHENCGNANGSINLSVFSSNGPIQYQWSNGSSTTNLANLSSGTYEVQISDALGCSLNQSYEILNNSGTLKIVNPVIVNQNCGNLNGSISIDVIGGNSPYSYVWSNGMTSQDLTNIGQGSYTVTVTDQTNCKVYATFNVTNSSPSMSLTFQNVVNETCNNNKGSIDINISGNYNYLWSNGATTQDLNNLNEGAYFCTITNPSNGCKLITPTYHVTNNSGSLTSDLIDYDNEYCNQNNGEIQIAVNGGTAPYTILWSNGATSQSLFNLNEGIYSYTITDASGCAINGTPISIVNSSGDMVVNSIVTNELCGNDLGQINLTVTGGVSPISYNWSNGASTEDLSNLSTGTYTYTVTDANQCSASANVFVANNPGILALNSSQIIEPNCGQNNGSIQLNASGNGVLNYLWSNGATTQNLTNIPAGSYNVIISDANNCSLQQSLLVKGKLNLYSANISNTTCSLQNGAIDLTVTGGSLLNYQWSHGANTAYVSNLAQGNYTVMVTSFENCYLDSTFTIGNNLSVSNCNVMCYDLQSTQTSGNLFDSGSSNGSYQNNENCSFTIKPNCTDTLKINFASLNTQFNDIITIRNGDNASAPIIGTYYGTTIPPTIIASSGAAYITFVSNSNATSSGFELNWMSIPLTTPGNSSFTISNTNPALNSPVVFTNNGLNTNSWAWDVNGDGATDYTTQNVNHIYSVPGTYNVSLTATNCYGTSTTTQTIVVQNAPLISLTHTNQHNLPINACDTTITYSFSIYNNGGGDLVWSGSNTSYTITPNSGIIHPGDSQIVNITITSFDFVGNYFKPTNINSNDPLNSLVRDSLYISQNVKCLYLMCNDNTSINTIGTITDSGGKTGQYVNNQNCSFLINPPCSDTVKLQFTYLNTQATLDYVTIYNGSNATAPLIGMYSGTTLPPIIKASSGKMFLTFTSNSSTTGNGFVANWSTTPLLTSPNSTFSVSNTNPGLNTNVTFIGLDNNATAWSWDVNNDGVTDYNTQTVIHNFNSPGTHTISLTATNCIGSTTITQTVTVQSAPILSISSTNADSITFNTCDSTFSHSFTIYNTGTGDLVWSGTNTHYTLIPSSGTISPGNSQVVQFNGASLYQTSIINVISSINSNDLITGTLKDTLVINQTINCLNLMCTNSSSAQNSGYIMDSGGANGNYSDYQNCLFTINPACKDTLVLKFLSLNIASSDYVRLYNGPNASYPILGTYSGTSLPPIVKASSGVMTVQFYSNSSTNTAGFIAQWSSIPITSAGNSNFTISNSNPPLNTSVTYTINNVNTSTYAWDIDGNGSTDYTSQNVNHVYTIPGTYNVVLTVTNCFGSTSTTKTITVQGAPIIELTYPTATHQNLSSCDTTMTRNFTLYNNGTGDLIWTGSNNFYSITPTSGTLHAGESQVITYNYTNLDQIGTKTILTTFQSNDQVNPIIKDTLVIHQNKHCAFIICNNTISTDQTGQLVDSGGSFGSYGNNENCGFLIKPDCADTLLLNFSQFNLSTTMFQPDYIHIYNGSSANSPLINTYTGTNLPPTLKASSGMAFIQFVSSSTYTANGFKLNWSTIPFSQSANSNFTISNSNPALNTTVNFTSLDPNATDWDWDFNGDGITDDTTKTPTYTYTNPGTFQVSLSASNCFGTTTSTQTITVQGPPLISINHSNATVMNISNCQTNNPYSFTIYNNGTGDLVWNGTNSQYAFSPSSGTIQAGDLMVVSYNVSPLSSISSSTSITQISSNDATNPLLKDTLIVNQTVNCLWTMCSNTSSSDSFGIITDSGGPNSNYLNGQNCSFLINPNCSDTLVLTFSNFQTENSFDYLRVYNGLNASAPLLGSYSGTALPPILKASSGAMYLVFTTDGSVTYSGFKANWSTISLNTSSNSNFTVSNSNPLINDVVNFTATDNNSISWAWDMENDGIIDYTTQTVNHSYTVPGTYTVSLSTIGCNGVTSTVTTQSVVVNGKPEIVLSSNNVVNSISIAHCDSTYTHSFTIFNTGNGDLIWTGTNAITTITPNSGTIAPGDSQIVELTIQSLDLSGQVNASTYISSNDEDESIVTDSLIVNQAFNCKNVMCYTTFSDQLSGQLFDSGGEFSDYTSSESCEFIIAPPCAKSIQLTINQLETENIDFLYVYDGTDDTGILLGTFSGFGISSQTLTATSGNMFIKFTSSVSGNYSGFSATWNTIQGFNETVTSNYSDATCPTCNDGIIDIQSLNSGLTYLWNTGSTSAGISSLYPGDYYVTISSGTGCDTTLYFTINSSLDLSENQTNFDFNVYPNPAGNYFYIDIQTPLHSEYEVIVTDVLGKTIEHHFYSESQKIKMESSEYEEGIYFITMNSNNQQITRKIMIRKE